VRCHFHFSVATGLQTHPTVLEHLSTTICGEFSLVVSYHQPKNKGILRKIFRKPTKVTIITKDLKHFKPGG